MVGWILGPDRGKASVPSSGVTTAASEAPPFLVGLFSINAADSFWLGAVWKIFCVPGEARGGGKVGDPKGGLEARSAKRNPSGNPSALPCPCTTPVGGPRPRCHPGHFAFRHPLGAHGLDQLFHFPGRDSSHIGLRHQVDEACSHALRGSRKPGK